MTEIQVGSILTGKVTGIAKFGAFVQVAPEKTGLVHISEIANSYVSDVSEFLSRGQEVTVKVIRMDENGRLNLSIKQAQPKQEQAAPAAPRRAPGAVSAPSQPEAPQPRTEGELLPPSRDAEFEDKLKKYMQDANSRLGDMKFYPDSRRNSRRRK